ncbi:hypothetical protein Zmor_007531 [Zophobas morio]|uniref:Uncharacterized protein n=1 Tax=Zophobas morio TaxID=2755281 RepID=A0AA38ITV1_9CUCU|nr:hypothetical protein Zmor_007531 [Zophobas morio]
MLKIIPTRLEWIWLDSTSPIAWTARTEPDAVLERPPSPLLYLSRAPTATSASRLFFSERRPAAVTDDESPIIAAYTRTILWVYTVTIFLLPERKLIESIGRLSTFMFSRAYTIPRVRLSGFLLDR